MGPRAAQPDDARSVTRNLRNLPAAAPLRAKHIYCNMMYTVATHLIEAKTQQPFSAFLEQRLFQPLRMTSSSLQPARARERGLGDRIASGHRWDKATSTHEAFPPPDCPEGQGAGSVVTSANDFIRWVGALLRREAPISEEVYRGLVRLRSFPDPDARGLEPLTSPDLYAAGLEVHYYRGHAVVGHDGAIPGFRSKFFFLPGSGFGAVVLGNAEGAGAAAATLCRALVDAAIGVPEADRPAKGKGTEKKEKNNTDKAKEGEPSKLEPERPPQVTPLSAYVGSYWNPGYRSFAVQVKDDKLFIDGTDRSMGFTLVFDHVADQTKYGARFKDEHEEEEEDPLDAEFVFENGKAVKMGLRLEDAIKELIWFEREAGS